MGDLWCIRCRFPMYVIAYLAGMPEAWICICVNVIQPSQRKSFVDSTPFMGVPLSRLVKDQSTSAG